MVISPPFLPVPEPGESDAQWLARAMKQQAADAIDSHAQEGSFPTQALKIIKTLQIHPPVNAQTHP